MERVIAYDVKSQMMLWIFEAPQVRQVIMQMFALITCLPSNSTHLIDQVVINSSPPGQNGHHFEENISRGIFMNEHLCILIRISLMFVPQGPIDNKSVLVQVMAWHQTGDKPVPEPMLNQFTDAYMQL